MNIVKGTVKGTRTGHLRSVSHQRDFVVIVDETLKPHRQCAKAAKNANSIMRTIKASISISISMYLGQWDVSLDPI